MNCNSFRKRQADLLDIDPDPTAVADLLRHMEECPKCAREIEEAQNVLTTLKPSCEASASTRLKESIMNSINDASSSETVRRSVWTWRKPLQVAVATLALFAVAVSANWLLPHKSGHPASAFAVLAMAADSMDSLQTMHMKAEMRGIKGDNFDTIDIHSDLIPVEIWREFGEIPKWRVEKPGRVAMMNGGGMLMLIQGDQRQPIAVTGGPNAGFVVWLRPLLDMESLFSKEQERATKDGDSTTVTEEKDSAGVSKTILTVEATAKGDFNESDILRDKTIVESDNKRVYTFDTVTRRLEGLKVYIKTASRDILVFQTTKIEYNEPVEASLFSLEVPKHAIRDEPPSGQNNSAITPKQAAQAILKDMASENWASLKSFAGSHFDDPRARQEYGGLRVLRVGEPVRSGLYPGWLVPYEIRLKSGEVQKWQLSIRNDNPGHQWRLDGGL